jgi:hypothetical protein
MKKKESKNINEKALELVTTLKANVEVLQNAGQDIAFIKALELSVRKTTKLEKEIVALKERLSIKKYALGQEKEIAFELFGTAKKVAKKELNKDKKTDKKEKGGKKDKKLKPEIVEETK